MIVTQRIAAVVILAHGQSFHRARSIAGPRDRTGACSMLVAHSDQSENAAARSMANLALLHFPMEWTASFSLSPH